MKKFPFGPRLRDESGMTLLEITIAAAIALVVVASGVAFLTSWNKETVQINTIHWLTQARDEIKLSIQDEKTFDATFHRPENATSFACALNKTDCRGAGGPIMLQAKAGLLGLAVNKPILQKVFNPADPAHPNAGLTARGEPCDGFTAAPAGSSACPFRFTVSWKPLCPASGACIDPGIEVSVKLDYNPTQSDRDQRRALIVNTGAYGLTVRKGQTGTDPGTLCASIHGHLNGSGNCVTTLSQGCPSGQFILGFTDDSQPYCGYAFGGADPTAPPHMCPTGQVLLGVDSSGVLHCAVGCQNAPAPSGGNADGLNIFPNPTSF